MKSVLSEREELPSLQNPGGRLAWGANWFVWGMWGAMLLAALAFVWKFGSNVPYWDEWKMVPILAGEQPINAAWLWSEHNGHRIPLPKLLLLAACKLTGSDFRVGMYVNVLALGAVAFIMIWVAKGLRGRSSYADAFFPLVLLHWGHCENFLWTWQLTLVTPALPLVFILLIIIVHQGVHLSFGVAVLAGLCLLMLPLCGFPGLVYVPALAIWLGFAGVQHWRSPERYGKPRALVIWGLMSAALLLVALYFVGYQEPAHHLPALHSGTSLIRFIRSCLSTTGQFLSGGFGPAAEPSWPYSGLVMLGLLLLTTGMLLRAAKRARAAEDRFRASALLLFIVATTCLALSAGLGRQGYGFTLRYFLLATPALCCVYFAWVAYGSRTARCLVQTSMLVVIGLASPLNYETGLKYARIYHTNMQSFREDLLARQPISLLLARHGHSLYPCPFGREPTHGAVADDSGERRARASFPTQDCLSFHGWLGDLLQALHRAGIGDFKYLQPKGPSFREIPLPIGPTASDPTVLGDPGIQGIKDDQNLILAVSEPIFVYGIRVTYHGGLHAESGKPPCLQVFWKRDDQEEFTRAQRYILYLGPDMGAGWLGGEGTETIWIHGAIDRIRVNLENNFTNINRLNLALLVPMTR